MKKLIALVLAVLMIAVLAVGCAQPAAPADSSEPAKTEEASEPAKTEEASEPADDFDASQYSLAVCMGSYNHPVHRQIQIGFIKEAESLGYKTPDIIGTDTADQTEQFTSAETWAAGVESGKAGMLLWNGDHNSDTLCKTLGEKGIYVGIPHFRIFVDDDQSKGLPEGVVFEMACDPDGYGREVAKLAAEALDGKKGSFALTQNTENVTENAATAGFRDEWTKLAAEKNLADIKILDMVLEGGEVEAATTINAGIIQANPDIIGAFGTTGNSPVTWPDAATKAGKKDGELWIAGMDATDANIANLEAGKVQVLVAQPLVQEAAKTADYFDTIFRGGTVPEWTDLEAGIVTMTSTGDNSLDTWKGYAQQVTDYFGA